MNMRFFLFLPVLFLLLITSCKEDEEDDAVVTPDPLTIVETAQATPSLSLLVEAVIAADLVGTLNSGTFTVLAPNNAAFQALLDSDPTWNSVSDIPVDVLTSVLLYHVLSGEVRAADLSDTYVKTQSPGPSGSLLSLQVNVTGGVTFDGDAAPLTTDVQTSNGVVHIIDKVMMPNSIVDFALANPEFSDLVAALTRPSFNGAFVTALTAPGPYTVFAPTNAAFQALYDAQPTWTTIDDIGDPTLQAVLNYHVFDGGNVQASQLTEGQQISMLGGSGDLVVNLTTGAQLVTGSGQTVNIILTDVQGTNGVIHVVDAVLLVQ